MLVKAPMPASSVVDRSATFTFVAGELPRHVDKAVRLDSRDLDDCCNFTLWSQEYLSFTWNFYWFKLIEILLLEKCPRGNLLARQSAPGETVLHLSRPPQRKGSKTCNPGPHEMGI